MEKKLEKTLFHAKIILFFLCISLFPALSCVFPNLSFRFDNPYDPRLSLQLETRFGSPLVLSDAFLVPAVQSFVLVSENDIFVMNGIEGPRSISRILNGALSARNFLQRGLRDYAVFGGFFYYLDDYNPTALRAYNPADGREHILYQDQEGLSAFHLDRTDGSFWMAADDGSRIIRISASGAFLGDFRPADQGFGNYNHHSREHDFWAASADYLFIFSEHEGTASILALDKNNYSFAFKIYWDGGGWVATTDQYEFVPDNPGVRGMAYSPGLNRIYLFTAGADVPFHVFDAETCAFLESLGDFADFATQQRTNFYVANNGTIYASDAVARRIFRVSDGHNLVIDTGSPAPEEFLFISDIAVLPNGRTAVLDQDLGRVILYDYLTGQSQTFGSLGLGLGWEMWLPRKILTHNDQIGVLHGNEHDTFGIISWWSFTGNHISDTILSDRARNIYPLLDGTFISVSWDQIRRFDGSGNLIYEAPHGVEDAENNLHIAELPPPDGRILAAYRVNDTEFRISSLDIGTLSFNDLLLMGGSEYDRNPVKCLRVSADGGLVWVAVGNRVSRFRTDTWEKLGNDIFCPSLDTYEDWNVSFDPDNMFFYHRRSTEVFILRPALVFGAN